MLLQLTPACFLLSSVFSLKLLLWGIPSREPSAAAAHTVAGEGGRELWGKHFSSAVRLRGGRMHLSCEPCAALSWCGKQVGSCSLGKQLVLAGQSLSILVKVSEVLPGYLLLVDCLKYQHVSLPLCSCASQPRRAAALPPCVGCITCLGLLWHLSVFG